MNKRLPQRITAFFLCGFLASAATLLAGGAWVPEPGDGNLQLGYSRKHAASSWNLAGDHATTARSTTSATRTSPATSASCETCRGSS